MRRWADPRSALCIFPPIGFIYMGKPVFDVTDAREARLGNIGRGPVMAFLAEEQRYCCAKLWRCWIW